MNPELKAEFENYYVKPLTVAEVTPQYLEWLNDKEVNEYLELKYVKYDLPMLLDYVKSFENDNSRFAFGIFDKETNKHIGNGSIYNVNRHVGTFDIGYLIGDKSYWGKNSGFATVLMLCKIAFEDLKMRKIFTYIYSTNVRSRFVMQKIGFVNEATLKDRVLFEGKPTDSCVYALNVDQWNNSVKNKYKI